MHISGFNLALKPDHKIVQAWRALDWWPDHYSVAIFNLKAVKDGTELACPGRGFRRTIMTATCRGWTETHWTPMKEILEHGVISEQTRADVEAACQRVHTGSL